MFKLHKPFVDQFKDAPVDWGPVGEVTYRRTYSRDGEEWYQTCERTVNGCYTWQKRHCLREGLPWDDEKAQHSAQQMYQLMFDFKFLPPGRGLFTMGVPGLLEKTGAAANNCGMVSTEKDPVDALCWAMDMLMLGVGVGFDTKGAGIEVDFPGSKGEIRMLTHQVKDSREGWVEAFRHRLDAYLNGTNISWTFDYSAVRPKGSPVGFGGTASGPEPLAELLNGTRSLLYKLASSKKPFLTSAHIVDLMNMVGRCIVSGNIRRSAEIAFGDANDETYLQLKNKDKYPKENAAYRWAANHSVMCDVGTDYDELLRRTAGVDELGVMWLDNARRFSRMGRRPTNLDMGAAGANPCAEQTLEDKELCCLVELFPSRHDSYYDFQRTLKYAYLYAKTVTLIPTHDPETNAIIERNRRIGCSLTGIQQAIVKHGSASFYKWCDDGYKYLKSLDDRYSSWFDIPRSIKLTSVKPSGTVSKLPGVSSGIHFPPAEHYFQRIRFASDSPLVDAYRLANYDCVDLAPDEPNTTVVKFPVTEEHFSRCEKDVSPWEQAWHAVKMQHHWADNQVSITVKYDTWERDQLAGILRMVEGDLKAISFFPKTEHSFKYPPWEPVPKEEVEAYRQQLQPVVLQSVHEVTDEFCSGEACLLPVKGD